MAEGTELNKIDVTVLDLKPGNILVATVPEGVEHEDMGAAFASALEHVGLADSVTLVLSPEVIMFSIINAEVGQEGC